MSLLLLRLPMRMRLPWASSGWRYLCLSAAEELPSGTCATIQFLAVPLSHALDSNVAGPPPNSWSFFCPPQQQQQQQRSDANASQFVMHAYPSFTALETVDGAVSYSVSVSTSTQQDARKGTPTLMIVWGTDGKVPVQWEQQFYAYTWGEVFTSASSNLNISLTLLVFLFPRRATFAPPTHREFRLSCKGCSKGKASAADEEERDLEDGSQLRQQSPSLQLRERMLA